MLPSMRSSYPLIHRVDRGPGLGDLADYLRPFRGLLGPLEVLSFEGPVDKTPIHETYCSQPLKPTSLNPQQDKDN